MKPLQVTFRGMEHSEAVESRVRDRVAALEDLHQQITSCHVTIDAPHRRHRQGNVFHVHMLIRSPAGDLVVNRERRNHPAHADMYVAIRDAFDAAERQLESHTRRHREHRDRQEFRSV